MSELFKRIDTVFLQVHDLDKAMTWYQKHFGFSVRWANLDGGYACLNIGETPLTLARVSEGTTIRTQPHPVFYLYAADVEAARKVLQEAGADLDPVIDEGSMKYFNFRDLDGNHLGVCSLPE